MALVKHIIISFSCCWNARTGNDDLTTNGENTMLAYSLPMAAQSHELKTLCVKMQFV